MAQRRSFFIREIRVIVVKKSNAGIIQHNQRGCKKPLNISYLYELFTY